MKLKDFNDDYYLPGFISIHMNTDKKLTEMVGDNELEHRLFHEYLHFIQDLVTTYGLLSSSVIYNQIKDVYKVVKENQSKGINILEIPVNQFSSEATILNRKLVDDYLFPQEKIINNSQIEQIEETIEEEIGPGFESFDVCQYKVYFKDSTGDDDFYKFGAKAIYEGICHILEKLLYKPSIKDLKAPYDLSYIIWCYNFPEHKDAYIPFLDLCEFSLMFYNSAEMFMKAIKKIKEDNIDIDDNLFIYLSTSWKTDSEENYETLFIKQYNNCVNDIKGFLTSEIYAEYRDWLLAKLEIGSLLRKSHKPLFSQLVKFKDATTEERTKWLKIQFVENIGYPPIINEEGEIFFQEANTSNIATSFFVAQAMYSVYRVLFYGKTNCLLKESCKFICETNNICDESPWCIKVTETFACPFSGVWKTWGLQDIEVRLLGEEK